MVRFLLLTFILQLVLMPLYSQDIELMLPIGHTGFITDVCFTNNSKYAATASRDGTVKVWEVSSGKLFWDIEGVIVVNGVSFSKDDRYLMISKNNGEVHVYDFNNNKLLNIFNFSQEVWECEMDQQNKYIIVPIGENIDGGSFDKDIVSVKNGIPPPFLNKHQDYQDNYLWFYEDISFSKDGEVLCINNEEFFSISNNELLYASLSERKSKFFPEQNCFYEIHSDTIIVIETNTFTKLFSIYKESVKSINISKSKECVLMETETLIEIQDFKGNVLFSVEKDCSFDRSYFSPKSNYLVVERHKAIDASQSSWVNYFLVSTTDWQIVSENRDDMCKLNAFQDEEKEGNNIIFSPDESLIITISCIDFTLNLYDSKTGMIIHRLVAHKDYITDFEFSEDGNYVITGSCDNTAIIWDITSELFDYKYLKGTINGVKDAIISPDGKTIAFIIFGNVGREMEGSGFFEDIKSEDHDIRIMDRYTGEIIHNLKGHTDRITTIHFNQNILTSTSLDGTIRFWDYKNGELSFLINTKMHGIKEAKFTSDDNILAIECEDYF